jgi:hypothetical protein
LSALVKQYLETLVASDSGASAAGVREMPMPYAAPPKPEGDDGPPWLVDGKWVYTRDGKPRQPGALRGMIQLADDWDEWPEGFLESMEKWDYDDNPGKDTA